MKKILLPSLMLLMVNMLKAQYGRLDQTFTPSGFTKLSIGKDDSSFQTGGLVQAFTLTDGKLIVVYQSGGMTLLSRKNADGSTDLSYRNSGFSTPIPIGLKKAFLQQDGKVIVIGGVSNPVNTSDVRFLAYRFNTDGTLDKTFGSSGQVNLGGVSTADVKMQADGRIVVLTTITTDDGTYPTVYLKRITTNGALDLNVSKGGFGMYDYFQTCAIQPDGKIVISGNKMLRFTAAGVLDSSFGTNGIFSKPDESATALAVQSDGKILEAASNFALFRYTQNGSVDSSFGVNGSQTLALGYEDRSANGLTVQPDGKILILATQQIQGVKSFAVMRSTANGFPDNSFSGDGIQTVSFLGNASNTGASLESNGRILISGYTQSGYGTSTDAAIARFDAAGSLDNSFSGDGKLIDHIARTNTSFAAVAVQPDGKAFCTGYSWNGKNFDFTTVRYNADATLDNTFSEDGIQTQNFGWNDKATSLAIQADGKIVVAGGANGNFALVRYKINGTVDSTFGTNGKIVMDFGKTESLYAIKIQADGKILVCGDYVVARYTSTGMLDRTFNGNGRVVIADIPRSMAIQTDGKILLGLSSYNTVYVKRLNTNGSPDTNFGTDGNLDFYNSNEDEINASVTGLNVSSNGSIVLLATITQYQFRVALHFTFLGSCNASQEITYTGNISLLSPSSLAIQSDGKILVAGYNAPGGPLLFSILRFNTNFTPDITFGTNGIQNTATITTGNSAINGIAISGNTVYAAGWGQYPSIYGVLARYNLGNVTAGKTALPITTNDLKLKLSPNPVKDLLYVELKTASKVDKTVIEISGLDGKKWDQKIIPISGKTNLPIDISKLPNGVYMMTVYSNGSKSSSTFIKQ